MKRVLSGLLAFLLMLSLVPTRALPVSAEQVTMKMVGDLDHDGEITDWDGVLLARHLAGWSVAVADEKILDIDGDEEITDWDGVMFDRYLAGWSVITQVGKSLTYSITYANTMGATNTNPTSYENGGTSVALTPLEAEHYTFSGWYIGDNKVTHIPTDGEGDLTITARWTPVEYTIAYANTKGAINSNPRKYNIESDDIVLQGLSCEGYRFDGWYAGTEKITEIPIGSTGNITLTAAWTACDYTITYENTKGVTNDNPNGFSTDSATITLTDLEKEGYTFDGWYNGNTKVTTLPSGTVGNITLTAQWTPISYTATFTADGSVVATRYFTIEDSAISSIPNVPSKAGYTGAWSNYRLGATNVVIPAIYTLNEYSITYANTKGADNGNLTNYTVITDSFNLSDLQCEGYEFVGWYKGNTKVTSIEKGTTGNITLTAKWSATDYIITYTDTKGAINANPVEYNIETGTIYLADISAEHYTFDGWYLNGNKVTAIPAGRIGDIELVARWTPISYNLTYQNTKGAANANPATYTVEDMIILQDISADGYTFDGWYIGNERVTTLLVGSLRNRTLTAKWTPVTYSVTYQNEKNVAHANPSTYTIESNTITLNAMYADGYTFDGWYNGSKKVTQIPAGSLGNLVLTAKWSINTYKITYKNTKDAANENPTMYTIEDSIILKDLKPSYEAHIFGYVFNGWSCNGEKITEIKQGEFGDLVLTAEWTPFVYTFQYRGMDGVENPVPFTTVTIETWPGDYELPVPSRDGYIFNGWKLQMVDASGFHDRTTITWIDIRNHAASDGRVRLWANWTPIEYKINYVSDVDVEITNPNPAVYTAEDNITLADASFDYFTFKGWYADAEYKTPVTTIEKGTFGEMTLYAKWEFNGKYIYSAEDFAQIAYDPSGGYKLMASITINSTICDSLNPFTGYFDGNNKTIYGKQPFDVITGTVTRVKTQEALATENKGYISYCIGSNGLVQTNSGTIKFSGSNAGDQREGSYVGGLVAKNSGTITQCYSRGVVGSSTTGVNVVGGLVGYNTGMIEDSYTTADVVVSESTRTYAAGLVGENNVGGYIYRCYAAGKVYSYAKDITTGYATVGEAWASGLVDRMIDGDMSNSFYGGESVYARGTGGSHNAAIVTGGYYNQSNYYATSLGLTAHGGTGYDGYYGTSTNMSNFKSPVFIKNTMGWSAEIWNLQNGSLPQLKWEQ